MTPAGEQPASARGAEVVVEEAGERPQLSSQEEALVSVHCVSASRQMKLRPKVSVKKGKTESRISADAPT